MIPRQVSPQYINMNLFKHAIGDECGVESFRLPDYVPKMFTGLPDFVRFNDKFIILNFLSMHFTVILADNIIFYIEDFIK